MSHLFALALPLFRARTAVRALSTGSTPPAELQTWMDRLTSRPPEYAYDVIDTERASQLMRALPTRQGRQQLLGHSGGDSDDVRVADLRDGAPLSRGHHLVYFRPKTMLSDLGPDGSSTEHNAPPPYTRRMWAAGSFAWSRDPTHALRVGQRATQITTVPRVELKKNMVFIHQHRVMYPGVVEPGDEGGREDRWAVKEVRTHVFRQSEQTSPAALPSAPKAPAVDTAAPEDRPQGEFTYTPGSPLLFLFSALTHNAHKVHYDRQWTVSREGHPVPLVHGPLTALLLVELAQAEAEKMGGELSEFQYRATSPVYVDQEVRLGAWVKEHGQALLLKAEQGARVGMTASARLHA